MKNMWKAFDSVTSTKEILKEQNKEKIKMPSLDEEQIDYLEDKIMWAYYTQNKILIKFYKNNMVNEIKTNIKKIDSVHKTITISNRTTLFFGQIIDLNYSTPDTGVVEYQ
jgi:peptidyl-tRNA hydrolase